jgi:hypothetical protein
MPLQVANVKASTYSQEEIGLVVETDPIVEEHLAAKLDLVVDKTPVFKTLRQ